MRALLFMRDIFKKHPLLFNVNILLLGLESLIEAVSIFALIPVVDFLIKADFKDVSIITKKAVAFLNYFGIAANIGTFLAIFLVFNILANATRIMIKYLILKIKYSVVRDLMLGTFEDFFRARWYFFSSSRQGMLINTFIKEITLVGDAFGAMASFFANVVHLLLYLAVPFYLSWQVTSVSLATGILFALPFALLGRISYRLGRLNTETANQISSVIQESLGAAKVILGFANQHESSKMLRQAYEGHVRATLKSQTISAAIPLMYYPLGLIVIIISLFVARRIGISLSETAALLYALLRIFPVIGQLPALKNDLDNFFPSYEQVLNLRESAGNLRQRTGQKLFKGFNQQVAIKNMYFAYPGHKPVLEDINIVIPKGKMVAVVGRSGAGKSTLIDMIMGFNEPTAGEITVDAVALRDFEINSYRRKIGYVPQDSLLFNLSVRDNLLWADENAGFQDLKEACRQANADEFIEKLPKGFDTVVGDRGVRLSGGQIQRIALARAILRKPDILILDEATSSLDTHSERLIQQAIENIAKETTIISIAHRLSTVTGADYIYVLKDGRIVEEGTYADLSSRNGEFRSMLQLQVLEIKD